MAGAKTKMLGYMLEHVGRVIPIEKLREVSGNVSDWARGLRTLRQEGWDIISVTSPVRGYILKSGKKGEGTVRGAINAKLRFMVLQRDNSRCQRCGRTVADHVKLHIDHIIPVEWDGKTEISNLQVLCSECNLGKKDFVAAQNPMLMKRILKSKSGYEKLKIFFEGNPNRDIPFDILETISQIRDWERTVRLMRVKEGMRIKPYKKGRIWYYRYES